jgi:hypothetical protein
MLITSHAFILIVISCHLCNAPMHEALILLHHTGSQEVVPAVVLEDAEEQPEVQEPEPTEAEEETGEELPECPDHRPSSFERGKPRSISSPVCNQLFINFT